MTTRDPAWLERSLKIAQFEGWCIDTSCTTCGMIELRLMLHGLLDVSHEDVPSVTREEEDRIWTELCELSDALPEDIPSLTPVSAEDKDEDEDEDEDEEDRIRKMVHDLAGDSAQLQRMQSLSSQLANIQRQRQEAQKRRRQQVRTISQQLERFGHVRRPYARERLDEILDGLREVGRDVNDRLLEAVLSEVRRGLLPAWRSLSSWSGDSSDESGGSERDVDFLTPEDMLEHYETHLHGRLRGTYAGEVLQQMRERR